MAEPRPNTSESSTLSDSALRQALAISDWLLGPARAIPDANTILEGLCQRLGEAGVPLDRATSAIGLLHAKHVAAIRTWERGVGARQQVIDYLPSGNTGYAQSTFAEAHKTGEWVFVRVQQTPDEAYGIVRELKQGGYTHHITVPVSMLNNMSGGFTFATKLPAGFSDRDVGVFNAIMCPLSALMEILATHRILKEVMSMYVGREPHERILAGDVHRGQVSHMRAAVLFADMRRFTALTAEMTAERATELLNDYYDCVVPAVEEQNGEVLKFIGDGILAVFRAGNGAAADVCRRAIGAARDSLARVANHNAKAAIEVPFNVGIALHFGEVAYGNVGSGVRLDFTVIGRDVNHTARIATLCGNLDEPLLVSDAFVQWLDRGDFRSAGRFQLKGLSGEREVFAPL